MVPARSGAVLRERLARIGEELERIQAELEGASAEAGFPPRAGAGGRGGPLQELLARRPAQSGAPASAVEPEPEPEPLTVRAAPFERIAALRAFESSLEGLPSVSRVVLRRLEGDDAAVFEVRLGPGEA